MLLPELAAKPYPYPPPVLERGEGLLGAGRALPPLELGGGLLGAEFPPLLPALAPELDWEGAGLAEPEFCMELSGAGTWRGCG